MSVLLQDVPGSRFGVTWLTALASVFPRLEAKATGLIRFGLPFLGRTSYRSAFSLRISPRACKVWLSQSEGGFGGPAASSI